MWRWPRRSLIDAAALPLVGSTALQALRDKAHLHAGQHLLVYGAADRSAASPFRSGVRSAPG